MRKYIAIFSLFKILILESGKSGKTCGISYLTTWQELIKLLRKENSSGKYCVKS